MREREDVSTRSGLHHPFQGTLHPNHAIPPRATINQQEWQMLSRNAPKPAKAIPEQQQPAHSSPYTHLITQLKPWVIKVEGNVAHAQFDRFLTLLAGVKSSLPRFIISQLPAVTFILYERPPITKDDEDISAIPQYVMHPEQGPVVFVPMPSIRPGSNTQAQPSIPASNAALPGVSLYRLRYLLFECLQDALCKKHGNQNAVSSNSQAFIETVQQTYAQAHPSLIALYKADPGYRRVLWIETLMNYFDTMRQHELSLALERYVQLHVVPMLKKPS